MHLPSSSDQRGTRPLVHRHLAIGWWSLLIFLSMGLFLEALHGIKSLAYLDATNEARRLMWRLAHAHGTLLSLVHVGFGLSVMALGHRLQGRAERRLHLAARCLTAALPLIPGGFFASGVVLVRGEPNPAVLLVPIGGLLLFLGVALTGHAVSTASKARQSAPDDTI